MRTALVGLLAVSFGTGAELHGYISDAACGWNNARNSPEAKDCARKCVDAGWDPVFVPDGDMNAYKIRDKRAVLAFVGEHVTITGELEGGTVTVTKIRKARKPAAKRS